MNTQILQENVLSDNILYTPENGKIFKGGYIAVIKEYVFQNPWCDREIVKKFRKREQLDKYLSKRYPSVEIYVEY